MNAERKVSRAGFGLRRLFGASHSLCDRAFKPTSVAGRVADLRRERFALIVRPASDTAPKRNEGWMLCEDDPRQPLGGLSREALVSCPQRLDARRNQLNATFGDVRFQRCEVGLKGLGLGHGRYVGTLSPDSKAPLDD